jgi:hypothetical protein
MRAKQVIIPGQEDPAELEAILRDLCEDWVPVGHTEIQLVEQIGLAEWRLRRVHRAELGEIRKQMPPASDLKAEIEEARDHFSMQFPELLAKGAAGIPYLREAVEDALGELEGRGTVSEETCDHLRFVFENMPYNPGRELRIWFPGCEEEEEDGDDEPTPAPMTESEKKAAARQHLQMALKDLDRRERKLQKQERTDLEIARQRLSIPQGLELERIQRYETSIKRDMYRAMDQLERLQRRRRGEPQPPTLNVNVSNDN